MSFKLKSKNQKWITYPDNKDLQFLIKPATIFTLKNKPSTDVLNQTVGDIGNVIINCTLDWKGFVNEDDSDCKCTPENITNLIEDPDAIEILMFVYKNIVNFNDSKIKEEEVKN